jgi:hypothetical protein
MQSEIFSLDVVENEVLKDVTCCGVHDLREAG